MASRRSRLPAAASPAALAEPRRSDAEPSRGRFITFEGVEGSGKTTQLLRLAERLRGAGLAPVCTHEPGGTEIGRRLREILLDPASLLIAPWTELLLYAADRAQHLGEIVEPALQLGRLVLCDRYLDATLAYQGWGRGLGLEPVLELHRKPPLDRRPDRTVLLDVDPAVGLARAQQREAASGVARDRFEQESLAFHERVRAGYLELASGAPERIRVIDGAGPPDEVAARVLDALADLVSGGPGE